MRILHILLDFITIILFAILSYPLDLDFEIASKSQGVCVHTHNKEVLRCKSGETVSRRY